MRLLREGLRRSVRLRALDIHLPGLEPPYTARLQALLSVVQIDCLAGGFVLGPTFELYRQVVVSGLQLLSRI
jgi:hypothetical protein